MKRITVEQLYEKFSARVVNFLVADGFSYPESRLITLKSFASLIEQHQNLPDSEKDAETEIFSIVLEEKASFLWQRKMGLIGELTAEDPHAELEKSERLERLLEAMNCLPEKMRTVYALSRCGRLNINKIADLMEEESREVVLRISRAKAKLAEKLKDLKYAGE